MATPLEQANQRVRAVEDALTHAKGKWSSSGVFISSWLGISPQTQVLGALETIGRFKDIWAARRFKLAATDQAGWDLWVKEGNDLLKNLSETAQDSEGSTLQGIVAQTVAATARDVQRAAVVVAETAGTVGRYAVFVLVVAVVGLFLLAKVRGKI